jgi:hypothetical protein
MYVSSDIIFRLISTEQQQYEFQLLPCKDGHRARNATITLTGLRVTILFRTIHCNTTANVRARTSRISRLFTLFIGHCAVAVASGRRRGCRRGPDMMSFITYLLSMPDDLRAMMPLMDTAGGADAHA